jgi:hypothetical protein
MADMNLYDAAVQISELLETNRAVFLKTEPEVPDHTENAPFKIIICGNEQRVEFEVESKDVMPLVAQFDATLFNKECVDRLYVYNFKSFATYFHAQCPHKFVLPSPQQVFIDLKVVENFLGIRGKKSPENLVEAVNRTKHAVEHKTWQLVYKAVHLPLSLKVLPVIETTALLNEDAKRSEYPYYEIEGQINGRMNCLKKFAKSYLPHNMGPDVKRALKPKGYGNRFLYADFRHCEVTVLQWLSGDPQLKEILDSGDDLHRRIYEILTNDKCDTDTKRNMSKLIFLPVMYGCGASRLGELIGVPETVAKELINRIKMAFPVAWRWMMDVQEAAKKGPVLDRLGRPRTFEENKSYLARDFVVQGVAATVCQEKLIELQFALNSERAYIAFTVHDGFGLVCKIEAARETYLKVKEILEGESRLCPGLRMKVEVKFGAKLDKMKVLWKD